MTPLLHTTKQKFQNSPHIKSAVSQARSVCTAIYNALSDPNFKICQKVEKDRLAKLLEMQKTTAKNNADFERKISRLPINATRETQDLTRIVKMHQKDFSSQYKIEIEYSETRLQRLELLNQLHVALKVMIVFSVAITLNLAYKLFGYQNRNLENQIENTLKS